jgi:hypothetical protein
MAQVLLPGRPPSQKLSQLEFQSQSQLTKSTPLPLYQRNARQLSLMTPIIIYADQLIGASALAFSHLEKSDTRERLGALLKYNRSMTVPV